MRFLTPLPTLARAAPARMLLPVAPDTLLTLPAMIVAHAPDGLLTLPAMIMAAGSGSSVLSSTADKLAGGLFGASLFPWLAMLYWLSHPTVRAPPGVAFGLTFLLAFVFGSIPAAIGAGALYGVSLANADWLHGSAESLLAVTNCIVVLGFRDALGGFDGGTTDGVAGGGDDKTARLRTAALAFGSLAAFSAVAVYASGGAAVHTAWLGGVGNLPAALWPAEPANALSVPTWLIHTSSLVEWLVAMGLAWRYADATSQPRWKGVTWGMLPLHTSGIVACTYHLFYNAEAISWCVALQAGMTCLGNTTLALACLRLALAGGWTWDEGRRDAAAALDAFSLTARPDADADGTGVVGALTDDNAAGGAGLDAAGGGGAQEAAAAALVGWEDLGDAWASDGDLGFLSKLAALAAGLAYAVKYAPALVPAPLASAWAGLPDGAVSAAALAVIFVPTLLNIAKWRQRSKEDSEFAGDF